MSHTFTSDIVNLNVGGTRFSTSRQTLTSVQDSFFTSMLSGRISSCRDETGALFIDRDPKLFSIILHFLRTKELDLSGVEVSVLRHEAEFYGITTLIRRLMLCEDLERSSCGDILFTGFIPSPTIPSNQNSFKSLSNKPSTSTADGSKPGQVLRLNNNSQIISSTHAPVNVQSPSPCHSHSRNSSADFLNTSKMSHSRKSSYETTNLYHYSTHVSQNCQHVTNNSNEIKQIRSDLGKHKFLSKKVLSFYQIIP